MKSQKNRILRLQHEVRKSHMDAAWISSAANRQYFSGFTGSAGWMVVPALGKPVFFTDGRYTQQARQEAKDLKIIPSVKDPLADLADFLDARKMKRLVFEDGEVSVATWKRLKTLKKNLAGFGFNGLPEKIRAVKDSEEIKNIKKAIQISEAAFSRTLRKIKIGMTERALAYELEQQMVLGGSEGLAFPTIVAAGARSSLPHAHPTENRLKLGDLLVMDFGCQVRGYHSDLTRTMAVGKMSDRQKEMYKTVKNSQKTAQKEIFSGKKASDSDEKAREILKKSEVEKYFVHSLGHGLGLEVHELPRLSSASKDELCAGMVVTCEPGVYLPGWGGIRIEDDLLVREKASEWLSRSSEELQVVGKTKI